MQAAPDAAQTLSVSATERAPAATDDGGRGATSCDFLWRGRLAFEQPARRQGYRFNLDPVLLAGFADASGHVLDFGAGCGIVGILLLAMGKATRVTAVEVQPALAEMAQRNAVRNGFGRQYAVLHGDLRHIALPTGIDHVVFNPPYYPQAQFRACANASRDQGRRECNGTLAHFVDRAYAAMASNAGAQMTAIVPAWRHAELTRHILMAKGCVLRQQAVLPRLQMGAVHALVHAGWRQSTPVALRAATGAALAKPDQNQFAADAPAPQWQPPLVLHADIGRGYTPRVQAWVDGPTVWPA